MRKKIIFIISALFLISLFLIFIYKKNQPGVIINGVHFRQEIAKTASEKEIGLSKYNKIEDNLAMVFPFYKSDYYSFWMRDMKFPIDIIYINKGKIVNIFTNVSPPSKNGNLKIYRSTQPADTVVEINAGLSEKYKFKKGDIVYINYK